MLIELIKTELQVQQKTWSLQRETAESSRGERHCQFIGHMQVQSQLSVTCNWNGFKVQSHHSQKQAQDKILNLAALPQTELQSVLALIQCPSSIYLNIKCMSNYASRENNSFWKPQCLMIRVSAARKKEIPGDLESAHHWSERVWTYGNQTPDQNVWRHCNVKNTLLNIVYLDVHMPPEHIGQWSIFPLMSCQVSLIS